jgi:hypothetical protein
MLVRCYETTNFFVLKTHISHDKITRSRLTSPGTGTTIGYTGAAALHALHRLAMATPSHRTAILATLSQTVSPHACHTLLYALATADVVVSLPERPKALPFLCHGTQHTHTRTSTSTALLSPKHS